LILSAWNPDGMIEPRCRRAPATHGYDTNTERPGHGPLDPDSGSPAPPSGTSLNTRSGPPDPDRLARYRRAPELGPEILFFSGGSALRGVSRILLEYTHRSTHLITPFDSGGSSAELRRAFGMPAVGDLRNRLLALADLTDPDNATAHDLLSLRFPEDEGASVLSATLDRMVAGTDLRIQEVPEPRRAKIRRQLGVFRDAMPPDFDLRNASVGNLVLAGGYLRHGRRLDAVLLEFAQLVGARGTVRPVVDEALHLVAAVEDDDPVVGQDRITRMTDPAHRIDDLFLSRSADPPVPYRPGIDADVDGLIRTSGLICYPVGSFYTSLVASLLPAGVSDAIAATSVPKVYVPNPGPDPEERGMTLADKVETLLRYLSAGLAHPVAPERLLQCVMIDTRSSPVRPDTLGAFRRLGVEIIDLPLVSTGSAPRLDPRLLTEAIVSLA
jgi:CofD-related protein of GAK system